MRSIRLVFIVIVVCNFLGCKPTKNEHHLTFDFSHKEVQVFLPFVDDSSTYSTSFSKFIGETKYYSSSLRQNSTNNKMIVYVTKKIIFDKPVLLIDSKYTERDFRVKVPITEEQLNHGALGYYDFSIGEGIYECFLEKTEDESPFRLKILKSRKYYDLLKSRVSGSSKNQN